MDFTGPAFRLLTQPPARDTVERNQKERDERLAHALGFDDPNIDPVNVLTEDEVRSRSRRSGSRPTSSTTPGPSTAPALRAPSPKGRGSVVQREATPPPSELEKARTVQVFARIEDDGPSRAESEPSKSDGRPGTDASGAQVKGYHKKLHRLFGGRDGKK